METTNPRNEQAGLEATCRFAVRRILLAQGQYERELDQLCDQFGLTRDQVQPLMDRMLQDEQKGSSGEVY